ncbi:hypothetical protein ABPG72_004804 [Tetrahymena utriculariae]
MEISQVFQFISLKYIQYVQIYLFFSYMIDSKCQSLFIGLLLLDKIVRFLIIYFIVKPTKLQAFMIFFIILFYFEELLYIYYNSNRQEQVDNQKNNIKNAFNPPFINIPMIPQVVFILFWNLMERNEIAFLLSIPCFMFLFFYINCLWSQIMSCPIVKYYDMILEFISLTAYIGMLLACSNIPYFFLEFFLVSSVMIAFMSSRYLLPQSNQFPTFLKILFFIPVSLIVLFNSGIEIRKTSNYIKQKDYKRVSNKTLNYLLLQKFIQNNFLLVVTFLAYNGQIKQLRIKQSQQFIIFIMATAFLYSLVNLIEIVYFYIIPKFTGKDIIEIETSKDLKKLNQSVKTKKFQQDQLVLFKFYDKDHSQEHINDCIFCLFFNFGSLKLNIPSIGNRKKQEFGMVIELNKYIDIFYFSKVFQMQQMIPDVYEIYIHEFYEEKKDIHSIFEFMKIVSYQVSTPIIVSQNMPNQIIKVQRDFYHLKNNIFYLLLLYKKNLIKEVINIKPWLMIEDLMI